MNISHCCSVAEHIIKIKHSLSQFPHRNLGETQKKSHFWFVCGSVGITESEKDNLGVNE